MITQLNEHTIRLEPDPPKRRVTRRPQRPLSPKGRKVVTMAGDAIRTALDGEIWYRRQLGRADRYQKALEKRGCRKIVGLPGYTCPPGAHKVLVEV